MPLYTPAAAPGRETSIRTFPCTSDVTVGQWVYLNNGVVMPADVTSPDMIPAIGLVIAKDNPTSAEVQFSGMAPPILSGLIPSALYYLSTGGAMTNTPLSGVGSEHIVMQNLGVAVDTQRFIIRIGTLFGYYM